MSDFHFTAGQAALWAQFSPNTAPTYLGCHEVGDIEVPGGDIELITCPDPAATNKFRVVGSVQQAAGAPTTEVTADFMDELDALERAFGSFNLFVHKIKKGRRDVFSNFDRTVIMRRARKTSHTLSNMAARSEDNNDRSEQAFGLSGEEVLFPMRLTLIRQSITEANAINDIAFCNQQTEATDDSPAQDSCQIGFAVADPTALATANVLKTTNGATWTATTDPFAADEVVIAVECFEVARDQVRVVVARGTTDAGAPAEIAYSDDSGTAWTVVTVGATNGQFAPNNQSLFILDRNNIWLATTGGYIYKSSDAALSWAAQESGVIHAGAWNAVKFVNTQDGIAGGAANVIAKTIDGGTTWSAVTGPAGQGADAIMTVDILDQNRFWIGYNDGKLFYTNDAGVTWSERAFTGSGVGTVRHIEFRNEMEGILVQNTAAPVGYVHMTVDGGYSWERLNLVTNAGLNAGYICDEWKIYAVGEPSGGTGVIIKGSV